MTRDVVDVDADWSVVKICWRRFRLGPVVEITSQPVQLVLRSSSLCHEWAKVSMAVAVRQSLTQSERICLVCKVLMLIDFACWMC